MYKVLYGEDLQTSTLIADDIQTQEETNRIIMEHLDSRQSKTYYLRFWTKDNVTTIDYGSHINFYYIIKKEF